MLTHNGKPSAVIPALKLGTLAEGVVFLDCRPFGDYDFCHLKKAIHVDIDTMLSTAAAPAHNPAIGGRNPLPSPQAWQALLRAWGVQPDSVVVAYDSAFGAEGAARVWWMLMASGIQSAVLDGGWDAAVKARLPINDDVPSPTPSDIKFTGWLLPQVDMETVNKLRNDTDWLLLDVRAPERWRGEAEHIDPVAGRIPGSKNLFFKENLDNGFFKKPEELRKMYLNALGSTPPARVIASCGSGMTACHTLLALYQAGLEGAALYVGSFSEWCRKKGYEIQQGPE